jgi:hypothetical protein
VPRGVSAKICRTWQFLLPRHPFVVVRTHMLLEHAYICVC